MRVMNEAIDLAIEGNSPYPDGSEFIDAEKPWAGEAVARAADEGRAVVLVSADGTARTLVASNGQTRPSLLDQLRHRPRTCVPASRPRASSLEGHSC